MNWPLWPKKIIKIAWFWWKLWLFCESRNTEIFSPCGFSWFFTIFTLKIIASSILVIIISMYTCETMILAKKIKEIGQFWGKLWPFCKLRITEIFSPSGFSWFFTIFTLKILASSILVIIISIYTRETMILAKKIKKIGKFWGKSCPFFKSKMTEIFTLQRFEKWP